MRAFALPALLLLRLLAQAQTPESQTTVPQSAEESEADAKDQGILDRTFYGSVSVEEIYSDAGVRDEVSKDNQDMVAAAQRRLTRAEGRMELATALIEANRAPASSLRTYVEEAERRLEIANLAMERAKLLDDIVADARQSETGKFRGVRRIGAMERFQGCGIFPPSEIRTIEMAYIRQFHRPLPISADGATRFHRSIGFDHRGRFDVALHPDQPEGIWLRQYLQRRQFPYFAFRAAMWGSATAPHIHIGPGSRRIPAEPALRPTAEHRTGRQSARGPRSL